MLFTVVTTVPFDLLSTGEPPVTDQFDLPVTPQSSRSNAESPGGNLPPPDVPESSVPSVPELVPTSNKVDRKIHLLCPLLCRQLIFDDRREKEGPEKISRLCCKLTKRFQDFVVFWYTSLRGIN